MKFLPREEKFFTYFDQQVEVINQAAQILQSACDNGSPSLTEAAQRISDLEHQGDSILHEIYEKLHQTFITPIDPEDIHALGSLLDDVVDHLEDASHRMAAYEIPEITQELKDLVRIIANGGITLRRAFTALGNQKSVQEDCIELKRLEGEADHLERRAVSELFRSEKDPIRLLKYKEIYEALELATDACEHIAIQLQAVAVKNS